MQNFTEISDFIVEQNNQFIVANKPCGMPSVPDKSGDKNLKNLLEAYTKRDLHIITRIDRPVSGLCVFAKNTNAAKTLTEQIQASKISKSYLAIVEGALTTDSGTLNDFLMKHKSNKSIVVEEGSKNAKKATLKYVVQKKLDNYTILEVEILTGRFHQIRSQLANLGHPIKGDVKYGARRKNKDRSIYLHAYDLSFYHPVTEEKVSFKLAPNPDDSLWKLVNS